VLPVDAQPGRELLLEWPHGALARCRRHHTAAIKAARRRGVALKVVEWPGGDAQTIGLTISDEVVKGVVRGRNRVPLAGSSNARISALARVSAGWPLASTRRRRRSGWGGSTRAIAREASNGWADRRRFDDHKY
jgi:hypothetical protein